ncbi:MAG TPA: hypothetical protein VJV23_02665 [Candidatus Polarisedimenticolia bacterium]|nr:hypothetical protein [Candidatus Polarisedimenticolia bacterium]
MSRVVIGHSIEVHFASPHQMVEETAGVLQGGLLFLETTHALEPGVERDLAIHVPWLGGSVRLKARVVRGARPDEPPGLHLRLADGPHDKLSQLAEIVGKVRSGAVLEENPGETSPEQRIRSMTPSLRAMLAAKANPEERAVLSRDPDPRVLEYLLKNPGLSLEEVRRLAGRLTMHHGHFAQILRNPAWMTDDAMRQILARNPRLPEFMAETVLQLLPIPVLKNLVESANTTASTRRVAVRVLQSRGVVVAARKGAV